MLTFGSRQRLLGLALLAAVAVTVFFGVRAIHSLSGLHPGADEPIRPWMNVPYIARSYHVPPQPLYQAIGLPKNSRDPRPIGRIAHEQNRPFTEVRDDLIVAIEQVHERSEPREPPEP